MDGLRAVGVVRSTTVSLLELMLSIFAGLGTDDRFDEDLECIGAWGNPRRGAGGAWGSRRRGNGVGFVTPVREDAANGLSGSALADEWTVVCVGGNTGVEDPGRLAPGRDAGVELVSSWSMDDTLFGISKMVMRLSLISSGTRSLDIALATKYGPVMPRYEAGRLYLTWNCSWR